MTLCARWLTAGLGVLALCGCERAPTPADKPAPPAARTPATASAPVGAELNWHDWVVEPPIADSERARPCLRLLSAAPNVTEICCALGLAPCLVGRTRYCTYPPAVQDVPSIGALDDMNAEALLGLRPELVLISGTSRATAERLTRLGLRYESIPDVTLADLFTGIERIGVLLERPETARRLCDGIRGELDRVTGGLAGQPSARVLLVTAPLADPPTQVDAAGPGSFYDDLLRLAGHTNAATPSGRAFAPLALEYVLTADPDVIIELAADSRSRPAGDRDALRVWAKLGPLSAVRRGRVHVLIGPQHFILGPRIAQTYAAIGALIAEPGQP